jgi:hypothetical protein
MYGDVVSPGVLYESVLLRRNGGREIICACDVFTLLPGGRRFELRNIGAGKPDLSQVLLEGTIEVWQSDHELCRLHGVVRITSGHRRWVGQYDQIGSEKSPSLP